VKTTLTYLIFLFCTNICFADYYWNTDWENNGNHWIGGWYINNYDFCLTGNFFNTCSNNNIQQELLFFNKYSEWGMLMNYTQSNGWTTIWSNNGNGLIDNRYPLNSDYDYLFTTTNINNCTHLIEREIFRSTGNSTLRMFVFNPLYNQWVYETGGNPFGGWIVRYDDKYISGNFYYPSDNDEVLFINADGGWAALKIYLTTIWANGGGGWLDGWHLAPTDRYFSGDLDGDGTDELICINPYNGWSAVFRYEDGDWEAIWASNNGYFGGWHVTSSSVFGAFDFDNDENEELFAVDYSTDWCSIKKFDATLNEWPDLWTNNGSGNIGDWEIQSSLVTAYNFGNFGYNPYSRAPHHLLPIDKSQGNSKMLKLLKDDGENITGKYNLLQNTPNPFNPSTKITFYIPKNNYVTLTVYDILGRTIKTLVNEYKNAGTYEINFDGSNLSSGTYFYRIVAGDFTDIKRLVLIK